MALSAPQAHHHHHHHHHHTLQSPYPPTPAAHHHHHHLYSQPSMHQDMDRWHPRNQKQIELESLPSNDVSAHYIVNKSRVIGQRIGPSKYATGFTPARRNLPSGNRGVKLESDTALQRKGRIFAWSHMVVEDIYGNPYGYGDELKRKNRVEETHVKKRFKSALAAVLPAAAKEAGQPLREEMLLADEDESSDDAAEPELGKRKRCFAPHLRALSPATTQSDIIHSLSKSGMGPSYIQPSDAASIGVTYLDLATSPAVHYTLGVANKERALMRTVDDLVDGENSLLGVLSRLQSAMAVAGREPTKLTEPKIPSPPLATPLAQVDELVNPENMLSHSIKRTSSTDGIIPRPTETKESEGQIMTDQLGEIKSGLQHKDSLTSVKPALDSSFLFGSGEPFFVPPGSTVTYEPVEPMQPYSNTLHHLHLSELQKLFVTPTGLTTTIGPSPNDPRLHLPLTHPGYPHTTSVRLTPETQKQSVICAIEKIRELAADCHEYVSRLEEIRERLANVGRARKKVWQIIRERAVLRNDGDIGDGEADSETMRLRAEAEHAISGSQVETRRRRGVATAVASAGTS